MDFLHRSAHGKVERELRDISRSSRAGTPRRRAQAPKRERRCLNRREARATRARAELGDSLKPTTTGGFKQVSEK